MFRVGLIGCGNISAVHAMALNELGNTKLVACADPIARRAEGTAEKWGCVSYGDWREMLDAERLDAVHICTPHYQHPVMAREAARRGIAVFTEKPPAIDAEGWELVKEAAKQAPVGICFQNRYNQNVRQCRKLLESGEYGALLGIRAFVTWNRTAEYYAAAEWKGKWASEGGGALINQAIHTLDLVLGFLGEPEVAEVAMSNRHLRGVIEVEDTVEIYLERGGVPALIYASNAYSQDAPVLIELHLERATVRLEGARTEIRIGDAQQRFEPSTEPVLGRAYWGPGHLACIVDFYRSVAKRTPYANAPKACETTMRVLLSLYDQCRESLK